MSRVQSQSPASKTTKAPKTTKTKKPATETPPVNPVAPGQPVNVTTGPGEIIVLKVKDEKDGPVREITVDKKKRIKDNTHALERLLDAEALFQHVRDEAIPALRQACYDNGAKYIESDNGIGQIVPGGDGGKVDVKAFWKLCQKKKIPLDKILSAVSVGKDKVTFLSDDELGTCIIKPEVPPQPRFTFDRRKDVPPPNLLEASERLAIDAKMEAREGRQGA